MVTWRFLFGRRAVYGWRSVRVGLCLLPGVSPGSRQSPALARDSRRHVTAGCDEPELGLALRVTAAPWASPRTPPAWSRHARRRGDVAMEHAPAGSSDAGERREPPFLAHTFSLLPRLVTPCGGAVGVDHTGGVVEERVSLHADTRARRVAENPAVDGRKDQECRGLNSSGGLRVPVRRRAAPRAAAADRDG